MGNQIINRMLKLKSRPMMDDVSSENFELVEGLILIMISIKTIIIGTIINSFLPSDINFVRKFANKK